MTNTDFDDGVLRLLINEEPRAHTLHDKSILR